MDAVRLSADAGWVGEVAEVRAVVILL
jgi:hypothetical protein